MRNRRRNWLFRRMVLGLAVAAIAAPTAQAGLDEGTAQSDGGNSAVIHGDDKVLAPESGGVLVKGDDKVLVEPESVLVKGDDKVFAPAPETGGVLVKGDDKVITTNDWQYSQLGYRHSMPQDYGSFATETGGVLVKGDDKVIATDDWQYSQFAYRHAMPQDYGSFATEIRVSDPIQGFRPTGRQVPIAATGTGSEFNWSDGLIVAAAALGLALLAFGAARSTGRMSRPATTA